jgi:paraquat-inducible protein B
LFAAFKADQLVRSEIDEMRAVVSDLNKALSAVDKQTKQIPAQNIKCGKNKLASATERTPKEGASSQKKLGEAQQRLKKAQTVEQAFFATLTKKQAKNGVCPFCQIKRISVDSHVMDMHPPRWGEYLTLLGKLK